MAPGVIKWHRDSTGAQRLYMVTGEVQGYMRRMGCGVVGAVQGYRSITDVQEK